MYKIGDEVIDKGDGAIGEIVEIIPEMILGFEFKKIYILKFDNRHYLYYEHSFKKA